MERIQVGIWGLGYAGRGMFIPELAAYPEMFQIVAGCDSLEENLQAAAKESPGLREYHCGDEFLDDPDVELVAIATRSLDHVSHALQALAAGKTVFLEKPIAVDYEGAIKLKVASEKYPGKLYFRHNRRFEPQFQHVLKICESGVLGELYEVKLHRHAYLGGANWQTSIAQGGGYLNNWGPHVVDHALIFLGSPVVDVWGNLRQVACGGDAEDHAKIILTGENGRIVDLEVSCGVAIGQPEYVIFGDRGALICKGLDVTLKYRDPEQKDAQDSYRWVEESAQIDPDIWDHPQSIWKYLYYAIRDGKPFPITTDHAIEIVRICEEVKKGTRFYLPH